MYRLASLTALIWAFSCLQTGEASPFMMPTAASTARLPFSGRGGAAFGRQTTPLPSGGFLESLTTGVGEKVNEAVETGVPTQLTYGFAAGFCSGMALKKVGQVAATVLGVGFVSLQTLSYLGYIDIKHDKFKKNVDSTFDVNKDGKIDQADFKQSFSKLMGVLTYNMPSGAGFVGGFMSGVRM